MPGKIFRNWPIEYEHDHEHDHEQKEFFSNLVLNFWSSRLIQQSTWLSSEDLIQQQMSAYPMWFYKENSETQIFIDNGDY